MSNVIIITMPMVLCIVILCQLFELQLSSLKLKKIGTKFANNVPRVVVNKRHVSCSDN